MAFLFNRTVSNMSSYYIIHKTLTFNHRDSPWINTNMKKLILEKMKWI